MNPYEIMQIFFCNPPITTEVLPNNYILAKDNQNWILKIKTIQALTVATYAGVQYTLCITSDLSSSGQ